MNIKGKHLLLVRFVADNYSILECDLVTRGFEQSMVTSLSNKGVISICDRTHRVYLPLGVQTQANVWTHKGERL